MYPHVKAPWFPGIPEYRGLMVCFSIKLREMERPQSFLVNPLVQEPYDREDLGGLAEFSGGTQMRLRGDGSEEAQQLG